jgi:hypothetical protein
MSRDEILDTLAAMKQQEGLYSPHRTTPSFDPEARKKMCQWAIQVTDFCRFARESVEIAFNYMDRYCVAYPSVLHDRSAYQLTCMTCLYIAAKIHEPEAMDPALVSNLSRGTYSVEQIETCERDILQKLQWRMNPPTALSFVHKLLELMPEEVMTIEAKVKVYKVCEVQTQAALESYERIAASKVAFCSILNALVGNLDDKVHAWVGYMLAQSIGIDSMSDEIVHIQDSFFVCISELSGATNISAKLLRQRRCGSPHSSTVSLSVR